MELYDYQKGSVIMVYTCHKFLHYLLGNKFMFYIGRHWSTWFASCNYQDELLIGCYYGI
jgi:hypothetical protein